ncbi:MAG: class I SAM-dependent methyltransferase [Parcubacteria group bacterium]
MKTNIDYWQQLLKKVPAPYKKWFGAEKTFLRKVITKGAKVLDVGCGDGRSILDILPLTEDVVGVDHDDSALEHAKQNLSSFPSVQLVKADATALPFNNEEFDYVICMGTFANFAQGKYKALAEMKRVLRDDGRIIISVYSENAFKTRMDVYKASGVRIEKIEGTTVTFDASLGDNISEQFSRKQLETIFSRANLKIKRLAELDMAYLCELSKR